MKIFKGPSKILFLASVAFFVAFSFAVSASPAFAQVSGSNLGSGITSGNSGTTSGCGASTAQSGTLPNPLCVSSVSDILYLAVDIATYIGVVLAVIFLIYAGFKYIAAQGNPQKITDAHHFLLAVIIGIAILIGASAIVNVVKSTLTSAGVVNSNTFNTPPQSGS